MSCSELLVAAVALHYFTSTSLRFEEVKVLNPKEGEFEGAGAC